MLSDARFLGHSMWLCWGSAVGMRAHKTTGQTAALHPAKGAALSIRHQLDDCKRMRPRIAAHPVVSPWVTADVRSPRHYPYWAQSRRRKDSSLGRRGSHQCWVRRHARWRGDMPLGEELFRVAFAGVRGWHLGLVGRASNFRPPPSPGHVVRRRLLSRWPAQWRPRRQRPWPG